MDTLQTESTQQSSRGRDYFDTLPYEPCRVELVCQHSPLYILQNYTNQPPFCGLCFFREGIQSELPTRLHVFKTLAENGNPETDHIFLAHLWLIMGLKDPDPKVPLHEFRRKRKRPRAREQYTKDAPTLFPVASSLWKLMGYQPPLASVLVRGAVYGRTEQEIAKVLDLSVINVHIRMAKAVRTAMGYIPHGKA